MIYFEKKGGLLTVLERKIVYVLTNMFPISLKKLLKKRRDTK